MGAPITLFSWARPLGECQGREMTWTTPYIHRPGVARVLVFICICFDSFLCGWFVGIIPSSAQSIAGWNPRTIEKWNDFLAQRASSHCWNIYFTCTRFWFRFGSWHYKVPWASLGITPAERARSISWKVPSVAQPSPNKYIFFLTYYQHTFVWYTYFIYLGPHKNFVGQKVSWV